MTRRGFVAGLLAAPAVVRAQSIWVPPRRRLLRSGRDMVRVTGGRWMTILRDGRVLSVIESSRMHFDPVIDAASTEIWVNGTSTDGFLAEWFEWRQEDDRA